MKPPFLAVVFYLVCQSTAFLLKEINMDAATFEVIWWQNEEQNKLMVLYHILRNYKQNHATSYLEQVLKRLLLTY